MTMNRRQFLMLTAAAMAAGCRAVDDDLENSNSARPGRLVAAGPAENFSADGLYGGFREQGFFVIRKEGKLFALSALCTHRHCKLIGEPDRSFYCKCHGSTFDPGGKVTSGPAKRDLPVLPVSVDKNGNLWVTVSVL